jgi:hypothetical protein
MSDPVHEPLKPLDLDIDAFIKKLERMKCGDSVATTTIINNMNSPNKKRKHSEIEFHASVATQDWHQTQTTKSSPHSPCAKRPQSEPQQSLQLNTSQEVASTSTNSNLITQRLRLKIQSVPSSSQSSNTTNDNTNSNQTLRRSISKREKLASQLSQKETKPNQTISNNQINNNQNPEIREKSIKDKETNKQSADRNRTIQSGEESTTYSIIEVQSENKESDKEKHKNSEKDKTKEPNSRQNESEASIHSPLRRSLRYIPKTFVSF